MTAIIGTKQIVITYVFEVPPGANEQEFAQMVASGISIGTPLMQQFRQMEMQARVIAPPPLVQG